MKTYYNKLIRDKIPEIITSEYKTFKIHILDNYEFDKCLKEKLMEEVTEFILNPNIEELADILEVIHSLGENLNSNIHEIETLRLNKKINRGGFNKHIYLEYIDS